MYSYVFVCIFFPITALLKLIEINLLGFFPQRTLKTNIGHLQSKSVNS